MDERPQVSSEVELWLTWLRQAQAGDGPALNRLLADVRPYLKDVVERLRRDQRYGAWDASDVVQGCLLRVAQHAAGVRAATSAEFLSWLATVARHGFLEALRDARRQKRDVRNEVALPEDGQGVVQLPADDSSPSQHAVRQEEQYAWEAAIRRLAPDDQQILRMRFHDRRPWAEIAVAMGRSEDAAKRLYFRAVERLRGRMKESP